MLDSPAEAPWHWLLQQACQVRGPMYVCIPDSILAVVLCGFIQVSSCKQLPTVYGVYSEAATWQVLVLQTGSMSGDLGPLNETAQAVRVMKEKYIPWQQRLDALIAQVHIHTAAAHVAQMPLSLPCLCCLQLIIIIIVSCSCLLP